VVILTLALGIGVNATFFTFFNGMILHPLPFEDPGRLVYLSESQPKLGKSRQEISTSNLRDWQDESRVFEAIAPYVNRSYNLHTEENPERVQGTSVSSSLFPLLGIEPILGRNFTKEEDRPGGAEVALIGYTIWQRRFAADPNVLGRTIHLNDRVHEVVGVMPPGFRFENFSEVWTPLGLDPRDTDRDNRWLTAIARLRSGSTVEEAQAEMTLIGERLEARYPETNKGWSVRVRALRDAWLPPVTQLSSYIQQAAVFFVLLIVCANVANLMLAQATTRRQETALRAALGAGRMRLVRQFLTESTILASAAGFAGTILALWGVVWVKELVLVPIPYWLHFQLDASTLAYALVITLTAGLVFGLVPALRRKVGRRLDRQPAPESSRHLAVRDVAHSLGGRASHGQEHPAPAERRCRLQHRRDSHHAAFFDR
jgi:putative ABC transport system permease protein